MDTNSIVQKALNLSPAEKIYIIEMLSNSLSEPDSSIDDFWKEEVEKRFQKYLDGKSKTISYENILKNES